VFSSLNELAAVSVSEHEAGFRSLAAADGLELAHFSSFIGEDDIVRGPSESRDIGPPIPRPRTIKLEKTLCQDSQENDKIEADKNENFVKENFKSNDSDTNILSTVDDQCNIEPFSAKMANPRKIIYEVERENPVENKELNEYASECDGGRLDCLLVCQDELKVSLLNLSGMQHIKCITGFAQHIFNDSSHCPKFF